MIDSVVKPVPKPEGVSDCDLYATHEGVLNLGTEKMKVYILNNGQRIIDAEDMNRFFGEDFESLIKK